MFFLFTFFGFQLRHLCCCRNRCHCAFCVFSFDSCWPLLRVDVDTRLAYGIVFTCTELQTNLAGSKVNASRGYKILASGTKTRLLIFHLPIFERIGCDYCHQGRPETEKNTRAGIAHPHYRTTLGNLSRSVNNEQFHGRYAGNRANTPVVAVVS